MKVLYLSLQGTEEGQAAHAHVGEIIKGLRRRDCDVRLATVRYRGAPSRAGRLTQTLITQVRAARSLVWADVVYVRLHFLSAPLVWLARMLRRQVVTEVNGTLEDSFIAYPELKRVGRLLTWLERSQLRRSALAVCVTEGLARWVGETAGHVRTAVVPNGANTNLFDPGPALERPVGVALPAVYAIFFGALSKWQGVATMMAATAESSWPEDVAMVVVGDGPDMPLVHAAASERPGRVVALGRQPYDVVPSLVSRSIGSLIIKEGPFEQGGLLPLKLYESLACAVPVIVTDYPGIADVVRENRLGYVIEPGDHRDLARRVGDLRSWGSGEEGRRWVVEGNSWDARAGQTLELLRSVVGSR